jgi:hypothetical protein
MGAIRAALGVLAVAGIVILGWAVTPTLAEELHQAFAPDVALTYSPVQTPVDSAGALLPLAGLESDESDDEVGLNEGLYVDGMIWTATAVETPAVIEPWTPDRIAPHRIVVVRLRVLNRTDRAYTVDDVALRDDQGRCDYPVETCDLPAVVRQDGLLLRSVASTEECAGALVFLVPPGGSGLKLSIGLLSPEEGQLGLINLDG